MKFKMSGEPTTDSLQELTERLRAFAEARDWQQFHSPKNLAMAIAAEVGELLEHFQWLTEEQSRDLSASVRAEVGEELADVLNFMVYLADQLQIDLPAAAHEKVTLNEDHYPVDKARGTSKKYNEL
jgi:dCTP diphosphatase